MLSWFTGSSKETLEEDSAEKENETSQEGIWNGGLTLYANCLVQFANGILFL